MTINNQTYQIEISYRTGDSFGSEDVTRIIYDIEWKNLDIVRENLAYIQDHYNLYMLYHKDWNADKKQLKQALEESSKEPWFAGEGKKYNYWEHRINLKCDDGSFKIISTFWCGYFESLWDAEIIVKEDPEMKISFR